MKQDNGNHAAHTPGRWNVSTWNAIQDRLRDKHEAAFIVKTDTVVSRFDELEANARLIAAAPETAAERDRLRAINAELVAAVNKQAEDEGLWFNAQTASEAYLQQELRKLHEIIESKTSSECARAVLNKARQGKDMT